VASTTQNTTASPTNAVTDIAGSPTTNDWAGTPGTAANWVIDGVNTLSIGLGNTTKASATLDYFPATIPDAGSVRGEVIEDVTVRVLCTSSGSNGYATISAKLRINGVAVGTSQTTTYGAGITTTGYDVSLSSWDTLPTEAQLESTQLGVVVSWEKAASLTAGIDGVSITAQYSNTYEVEERIYSRLSNYTALTTMTDRIYTGNRPQESALPAVSVERISSIPAHAMSADPNYVESRFQVNCYADDPLESLQVARQVHNALSRWDSSTDNVEVLSSFEENRWNDEVDIGGADGGAFWTGLEYQIVHRTS